jgi:TolB-like protein
MKSFVPSRTAALVVALCVFPALQACGGEADAGKATNHLVPGASAPVPEGQAELATKVSTLGKTIAPRIAGRSVAVLDFPDLKGNVTELGTLVSEQLTTELVNAAAGGGQVLERKQVLSVLEELNLRKANLTESEVALAAEQLGAQVIIVGSASIVGRSLEVNVRAVDVGGGAVLAADRFSVAADADLQRLAGRQSVAPTAPGTVAGVPAEPGTPVMEATVGPVNAQITECRAAGSEVTCLMSVTSATVDAKLNVNGYATEARDDGGNAYQFSEMTFGSQNAAEWETLLVAREPTPARFIIAGVPVTMTRLTRVAVATNMKIGERELYNQELVFRNVPIVRAE